MGAQKIGIDIIDVKRFKKIAANPSHPFIKKTFTVGEIKYCYHFVDPSTHLAGIFALKEAVFKATGKNLLSIEVKHTKNGAPEIWLDSKKNRALSVSISHTDTTAVAVAIN